ncbi:MAG: hypothetical protein ACYTGH_08980 [Planctomycetota bacterium]|jgi:hypothetical protein
MAEIIRVDKPAASSGDNTSISVPAADLPASYWVAQAAKYRSEGKVKAERIRSKYALMGQGISAVSNAFTQAYTQMANIAYQREKDNFDRQILATQLEMKKQEFDLTLMSKQWELKDRMDEKRGLQHLASPVNNLVNAIATENTSSIRGALDHINTVRTEQGVLMPKGLMQQYTTAINRLNDYVDPGTGLRYGAWASAQGTNPKGTLDVLYQVREGVNLSTDPIWSSAGQSSANAFSDNLIDEIDKPLYQVMYHASTAGGDRLKAVKKDSLSALGTQQNANKNMHAATASLTRHDYFTAGQKYVDLPGSLKASMDDQDVSIGTLNGVWDTKWKTFHREVTNQTKTDDQFVTGSTTIRLGDVRKAAGYPSIAPAGGGTALSLVEPELQPRLEGLEAAIDSGSTTAFRTAGVTAGEAPALLQGMAKADRIKLVLNRIEGAKGLIRGEAVPQQDLDALLERAFDKEAPGLGAVIGTGLREVAAGFGNIFDRDDAKTQGKRFRVLSDQYETALANMAKSMVNNRPSPRALRDVTVIESKILTLTGVDPAADRLGFVRISALRDKLTPTQLAQFQAALGGSPQGGLRREVPGFFGPQASATTSSLGRPSVQVQL